MRPALASVLALALAAPLPGPAALAQSNPSAEQIIEQLKPTGPLSGDTRGIRLVPPTQAQTVAADAAAPSVSLTVVFATGSAELTPAARRTLDQLGRALASPDLASYRFRIEGHTDTVGTPAVNQALSQRRADAVAIYLVEHAGVAAARLQSVGLGEAGLAVPTPPQTANAQNRRVKVVNLGA